MNAQSNATSNDTTPVRFIDMTPTWGEIGLLFMRLALSKEVRALQAAMPEIARAFALASAFVAIKDTLNESQRVKAAETINLELIKQGHGADAPSSSPRL